MPLNIYGYDRESHENACFSIGNFSLDGIDGKVNVFLNSRNMDYMSRFVEVLIKNKTKEVEFFYYSLQNRSFHKNFDSKIKFVLRQIKKAKTMLGSVGIVVSINNNNPLYTYFFLNNRDETNYFSKDFHNYLLLLDKRSQFNELRIDVSTKCNLRCPKCPTGTKKNGILNDGFMSLNNFKAILEKFPQVKSVELSNFGEIFINPEIDEIIDYAYGKKKTITVLNGTNLNILKDSTLERITKIKEMVVSIDGATREVYEEYRIGGNIKTVLENIKKINSIKHETKTQYPILTWQFLEFEHNVHELEKAKMMAKELDMKFVTKIAKENVRKIDPKQITHKMNLYHCAQNWLVPQINWDGQLLGCCNNLRVPFGNVIDGDAFNSEKFKKFKEFLTGQSDDISELPCQYCIPMRQE